MDRIARETESIITKTPILIGGDTPRGYNGVRTTIQIRDYRSRQTEAGSDFSLDAVINTEFRRGPRTPRYGDLPEEVATDHKEVVKLLLEAIKVANQGTR